MRRSERDVESDVTAPRKPASAGRNRASGSWPIPIPAGGIKGSVAAAFGVGYVLAIVVAEMVTTVVSPLAGVLGHVAILAALLAHGTLSRDAHGRAFYLALSIAPLVRIASLGMPLSTIPQQWWYALASLPLLAACYVTMSVLGLGWRDVALQLPASARHWIVTGAVATSGIAIGYIEFSILRPDGLIPALSLGALVVPAVIMMVSTGFTEELIFRGVMHVTAVNLFGTAAGVFWVSVVFAALHIGHLSALNVGFVMLVSLYFGTIVWKTRTLLGVALAHGFTNIGLFLVYPNL